MKKECAMKVVETALANTFGWSDFRELEKIECGAGRAYENGYAWSIRNCIYAETPYGDYIINYSDYDEWINLYYVVKKDNICIGYKYIDSRTTHVNQITLCAQICNMINKIG